ncbi:hypothetical protein GPALN_013204 [Globodera pallida]|nr:hypothetical protein GPALN_013204 [Globodera pallida]
MYHKKVAIILVFLRIFLPVVGQEEEEEITPYQEYVRRAVLRNLPVPIQPPSPRSSSPSTNPTLGQEEEEEITPYQEYVRRAVLRSLPVPIQPPSPTNSSPSTNPTRPYKRIKIIRDQLDEEDDEGLPPYQEYLRRDAQRREDGGRGTIPYQCVSKVDDWLKGFFLSERMEESSDR